MVKIPEIFSPGVKVLPKFFSNRDARSGSTYFLLFLLFLVENDNNFIIYKEIHVTDINKTLSQPRVPSRVRIGVT
jgi:hypothetical protein